MKKDLSGTEHTQINKTGEEDSGRDKKNWMSSVQLWNTDELPIKSSAPHLNCNQNQNQNQNLVSESQKVMNCY